MIGVAAPSWPYILCPLGDGRKGSAPNRCELAGSSGGGSSWDGSVRRDVQEEGWGPGQNMSDGHPAPSHLRGNFVCVSLRARSIFCLCLGPQFHAVFETCNYSTAKKFKGQITALVLTRLTMTMTMTMTMTHSEKSHIHRTKAWPYRQECRDHGPTKKESVLLVKLARWQGAQVQTVKRQNVVQRYLK